MTTTRFKGIDYSKHYFEGWTTEAIINEIEFGVCSKFQWGEIKNLDDLKRIIADETPYKKKAFPEVVKHFRKKLFGI